MIHLKKASRYKPRPREGFITGKERLYFALGVVALWLLILFVAWVVKIATAYEYDQYGTSDGTAKKKLDYSWDYRYASMEW